jgi:peptidoglycan/LPS O-acetylase OafA/YrhL
MSIIKTPLSSALNREVIYFEAFNAFLLIAAITVVFVFWEDVTTALQAGNFHLFPSPNTGGLVVTFFFVLSEFLITCLVMAERTVFNKGDISKFY